LLGAATGFPTHILVSVLLANLPLHPFAILGRCETHQTLSIAENTPPFSIVAGFFPVNILIKPSALDLKSRPCCEMRLAQKPNLTLQQVGRWFFSKPQVSSESDPTGKRIFHWSSEHATAHHYRSNGYKLTGMHLGLVLMLSGHRETPPRQRLAQV
jgi:hypothetical protein